MRAIMKNKGGRPKYEIDYKTLDNLCGILCTAEEISSILDIDRDTLTAALKRDGHGGFSAYFKKKSSNGKASLRRKQFKAALDGNPTMLVWLGKQHLNQTDKSESKTDHVSSDGSMSSNKRLTEKEIKLLAKELNEDC